MLMRASFSPFLGCWYIFCAFLGCLSKVDMSVRFTCELIVQGELPTVGFLLGLSANSVIQVYRYKITDNNNALKSKLCVFKCNSPSPLTDLKEKSCEGETLVKVG